MRNAMSSALRRSSSLTVPLALIAGAFTLGLTQCEETCFDYDENGNRIEFACTTCVERDDDPCSVDSWRLPPGSTCTLASQPTLDDGTACAIDTEEGICAAGSCRLSLAQTDFLLSDQPLSEDSFGYSTAVDGDTLVVSTYGANVGRRGTVQIFTRQSGVWTFEQTLTGPSAIADQFGFTVDIDNDTIVVGSVSYQAAFVYVRNGATWTEQARLERERFSADDFGRYAAISGDTIVVAAGSDDSDATGVNGDPNNSNAPTSGAVYVFVRNGATWAQQAYLKASNAEAGDGFNSPAIDGDTIVISATGEDSAATGVDGDQNDNSTSNSGAAYVFVRNGTTWTQQAYLKASNTETEDRFGDNVGVSGNRIAIAAREEDSAATGVDGDQTNNGAPRSGAVYVFERDGTTWTQEAYLKASNTGASDSLGRSLALTADTLVVGTQEEDSIATGINGEQNDESAPRSGAAYMFVRGAAGWNQTAYIKASNTAFLDFFGTSVALGGDTLVVGAVRQDSGAFDGGAVYVFGLQ